MENEATLTLKAIVYQDEEEHLWIARCLELNIIGAGSSPEEAVKVLDGVVDAHIAFAVERGISPWHPAAARYWDMFAAAMQRRPSAPAIKQQALLAVAR